jgi:hypothetical protein
MTPVGACRPERPPVNSYQVPFRPNGIGQITVTIETNGGSGIGRNSLNIISVSDIGNATVEIDGVILDDMGQRVVLDDGIDGVDIVVRRIDPDEPFWVAFRVFDDCNDPIYTPIFGGPAQPTPTPTPTVTPTPTNTPTPTPIP